MTVSSSITDIAVSAFRNHERAQLAADAAEYRLEKILAAGNIDMTEYYRATEEIRAEYDKKRDEFEKSGSLPGKRRGTV